MRSNSSAEAALHIVLLLAAAPEGREIAASDLADFHELSRLMLAKLLQQLAAAKVVASSAGRHGGYRLARAPREISVYQVVSSIGGVEPVFHCHEIRRVGPCAGRRDEYSTRCSIAQTMDSAAIAWRTSLENVSIADLLKTTRTEVAGDIMDKTGNWLAAHVR